MERDTVIFDLIKKECQRQKEGIELIASCLLYTSRQLDITEETVRSQLRRGKEILRRKLTAALGLSNISIRCLSISRNAPDISE